MHLVKQLFRHGRPRHQPARAGRFADNHRAVPRHLRHRKADTGEVGNVLEPGIGEIAAADLRAAFQHMPADHPGGHQVMVASVPAEFMHQGSERQRAVGRAPHKDHIRPGRRSLRHRGGAEIGVGGDDRAVQDIGAVENRQGADIFIAHQRRQIIAKHGGDFRRTKAHRLRQFAHAMGALHRVRRAEIAYDPDARRKRAGQDRSEVTVKPGGIARAPFGLRLLRDRQRAFGEAFIHQPARTGPPLEKIEDRLSGVEPVTCEPRRAANQDMVRRHRT